MKPMLAGKIEDVSALPFPCYISAKLDGIRVFKWQGQVLTRKLTPLRNDHLRTWLERVLPEGADGELLGYGLPGDFHKTSGDCRRITGKPNLQFYWFDLILPGVNFLDRQAKMAEMYPRLEESGNIILWPSLLCNTAEALLASETEILERGLEGVMVRSDGPYKYGRSTLREGYLLKLKRFEDAEARVTGFVEQLHNGNTAERDALGRTKRSTHQGNMTGKGTLGALMGEDLVTGNSVRMAGFTAKMAQEIWNNQAAWLGQIVKYKWFKPGTMNAPRHPIFGGIRDAQDMDPAE